MVSQNMRRTCEGKHILILITYLKFVIAGDLNKCLKQIKLPSSLKMGTPISELTPNKSAIYISIIGAFIKNHSL